ncbi:MAG: EamA family transporter, partial [Candidatus Margulisiibacteriota bacterium]|nr:EamA family transporter [Candidatus Margulisiibacteriota bacterium]
MGIILLSFTAVISKLIIWPVLITVFARSGLAFLFLLVILLFKKEVIKLPINTLIKAIIGGVFLAIHWWTYFKAVELAGVAIGLCSLFTFPIITAIIEPFILKKKVQTHIYFCSIIALIGISIL